MTVKLKLKKNNRRTPLRGRGAGLRVLNLGGGDVDTATPMGSMVFTVMAALAQMEQLEGEWQRAHEAEDASESDRKFVQPAVWA